MNNSLDEDFQTKKKKRGDKNKNHKQPAEEIVI
jgi:hypothetical protein